MFMEHMANGLNGMQELFLFRKKRRLNNALL